MEGDEEGKEEKVIPEDELVVKLRKQLEAKDKELEEKNKALSKNNKQIEALRKALNVRIRCATGSNFPDLHAALAPSIEETLDFEQRYSDDPRYKVRRKRINSSKEKPGTTPPVPPSRPRNLPTWDKDEEKEEEEEYIDRTEEFENFKTLSSSLTQILVRLTEFRGSLEEMQKISSALSEAMKCENELRSCPKLRRKITPMLGYLRWFRNCLEELNTAQNILNVSLLHGMEKPLREFLNNEIIPLSQLRWDLEGYRSNYEQATSKLLQTRQGYTEKLKSRMSHTIKTRHVYERKRLDVTISIEHVLENLNGSLSENFLSALYALLVYFGHCESHTKNLHEKVKRGLDQLSESISNDVKIERARKDATRRSSLEAKLHEFSSSSFALSPLVLQTKHAQSGYLFCKIINSRNMIGNTMKDWALRWFTISATNKLCVCIVKKNKKGTSKKIVELADLTISTVKIPSESKSNRDNSRMFRFDIISADSSNGKLLLQAGSIKERDVWISTLRSGIASSLRNKSTTTSISDRLHRKLLELSPRCADCGAEKPVWCSVNLGVTVCIACSGIHRSLGVAVSKIRSLDMDSIPVTQMQIMVSLGGNDKVNSVVWESGKQRGWKKLNPNSDSNERCKYITAKYRWRGFVQFDPSKKQNDLDESLIREASQGHLLETLLYIAQGANIARLDIENIHDEKMLCSELVLLNKRNAVGPAAIMEQ